jgi:hypothetical protein
MSDLHAKFLATVQSEASLLHAVYREPSITAYNRLEPRARTEDFSRSLRAEVRDPLWMLTRQWQMGELEGEDAGTAVDARLLTAHTHVDRVALKGETGRDYDENIPLETMVERETIPFTHALRVQIGLYFLKLHSAALRAKYEPQYRIDYAFDAGQEESFRGQIDGLNLYLATKSRAIDGRKVLDSVTGDTLPNIETADDDAIKTVVAQLRAWLARQYSQPVSLAESAWDPEGLTYRFRVAAPKPGNQQFVLDAGRYHEGRVDWYSFDADANGKPLTTDAQNPAPPPAPEKPIAFIPAAASFKGMPNPRFWEMENRQVNFGKLNAQTTDHLLLLFAELGLVYGNDWFVIPYSMPVNTLCEIRSLVITDVFGDRTLIGAADEGQDNAWQRWSMFNLSNKGQIGQYNRQFFLPAALTQSLESEPLEQVNFLRDEMANMVWAVEERIPDATGRGINGHDAADKSGILPPPIAASPAAIRYLLGTSVPENWIPFLPVHEPGSVQQIRFQRAAMPKLGVPPKEVIKAKGVLLNEVPPPYYVDEEEVPSAGTLVRRAYQRTRWYGGRTYVWIGRYRETGRGLGSSNLRFDQIEPVQTAT